MTLRTLGQGEAGCREPGPERLTARDAQRSETGRMLDRWRRTTRDARRPEADS